jgi:hypothetical protein
MAADLPGTHGGLIDGGLSNPRRSRPGNTSPGVEKKTANPREKKLGEFPGSENMSLGI